MNTRKNRTAPQNKAFTFPAMHSGCFSLQILVHSYPFLSFLILHAFMHDMRYACAAPTSTLVTSSGDRPRQGLCSTALTESKYCHTFLILPVVAASTHTPHTWLSSGLAGQRLGKEHQAAVSIDLSGRAYHPSMQVELTRLP